MEVERSVQHIHLDHHQLLTLVRRAFPQCQKVDEWRVLSGGALNTTYKFTIGRDAFVLRFYARDRSYCKTEKAICQLIDKTVSIPKLIYADESYEPWAYSIFAFVSGVHISEVSNRHKTPLCYELGRTLASVHAYKFPHAGLFGEGITIGRPFAVGSSPYFEEAFSVLSRGENVRQRLGDKLTDDALAFIQKIRIFFR
jgi:aminoglycoside phosphotransferase (APT) family kinase protein